MLLLFLFFFNDTATTEIYTLSLHDALPIYASPEGGLALHLERQERAVRGESRVLLEVRSASVVAVAHLHIDAAVPPHGRDLRAGHPPLEEHRIAHARVGERRAREREGGGRGHHSHGRTVARGRRQRPRAPRRAVSAVRRSVGAHGPAGRAHTIRGAMGGRWSWAALA